MSIGMKKIVALLLALLMVFAIVACAEKDAKSSDTDATEETTTAATEAKDDEDKDDSKTPTPDGGNGDQGNGDQGNGDQGNTPTPEPEPEPEPDPGHPDFELIKAGKAQFAFVSKNEHYDAYAEELAAALSEKTDVLFLAKDKPSTGEKAIYVGNDPAKILGSKATELTYNGYVIYEMNGHLYLMGHTQNTVKAAGSALLEAITPDTCSSEDGKLTVTLPGSLISMKNPESYPYRDAKLLGESLSKYVIILPADYTVYERFVADELIELIGNDTGYKLEYIKDSKMTAAEYRIVIGQTSYDYSTTVYENVKADGYLIQNDGKYVYVAFDNYLVSSETPEVLAKLYRENATAVNTEKTFDYSSYLFERPEDTSIRFMSNNVTVVQDAYSYERANDIEWTDRMEILSQMYLKYLPDFISLQEVQYDKALEEGYYGSGYSVDMYGYLQERLGHKYTMLGQTNRMTAIFYQTDVWKLEASGQGQFNAMHPWYWGLFSRIDDPTVQVIVMDIHYAGEGVKFDHTNKYADGPADYDGLTNGQVINIVYKNLAEQYAGVPIFVMGDFNSKYSGGNFNATIKDTTLNSASKLLRDEQGKPMWGDHYTDASLNHGMFADPIDHILVPTDKAEAISYRFINEALMRISSGHRPIMADIKLYPVSSGSGNGMDWNNGVAPSN